MSFSATAAAIDPDERRLPEESRFQEALQRYWGYATFRPRQEEIIRALASGRDLCVVMPTGGGKSLCYQLPAALAHGRTAIVVSPLIALMQDQVAQLAQMGIPASFLNSATKLEERADLMRRITAGSLRLLYLSPERLVLDRTAAWLQQVPISFFAIDEAHCISEWGHDFRPEYRQLSRLRELFPGKPIAAFTASATQRVRQDIVEQLRLRDAFRHIASFQRSNLRYCVKQTNPAEQNQLLLHAINRTADGNIIVYAPTIARVEETVDLLQEHGVACVGYHGQMGAQMRRANQEKWMSDEVRVIVGTLAFGLGINKPSVRAVIHLALPKSIEQYYQESGRAGRDGLSADCYLFWQYRDARIHSYFISQVSDAEERRRAQQRYEEIENFVKVGGCRPRRICLHFGETPKWERCGQCDACAGLPDWLGEAPAKDSEGAERRARGRQARREMTRGGADAAARRSGSVGAATFGGDYELRRYLQEWRRAVAQKKGVSAVVVMEDPTLDDLCLVKPQSLVELCRVSGFGEGKVAEYGERVLEAIRRFRQGARAAAAVTKSSKPAEETLQLLREGRTFEEIAATRGRLVQAVVSLVAEMVERGDVEFQSSWLSPEKYSAIAGACERLGTERLKPIKQALSPDVTYEEIKLVAAELRQAHRGEKANA